MQKNIKVLLLALASCFVLTNSTGCSSLAKAQTPSEEEINAESAKAYQEVKAKSKISNRKDWNDMVQRVANRIARASGENFQWEIVLIDNEEPNAWCMPGGKMAVYTGIMPILKTEGALAAVMGHEVAHATRRHGQKGYARAIEEQQTGALIGVATAVGGQILCKTEQCRLLAGIGGAAAGVALTFFNRKFSREDETEADQVGQVLMAKAGYDPAESIVLWERMNAAKGGEAPEWMSTHPSDANRRAKLTQLLPQAQQVYQQSAEKYGKGATIQ
ncbi:MAG: M48 family metallopeptidase [Bdellovibrionaceae bacterium]|nr:M48 family metallopeptidase [Pseudobdellovibrionaceae bacterium]